MNRRENSVNSSNAENVNGAKTVQPRPPPVWRNTIKYNHQQQSKTEPSIKKLTKPTPPAPPRRSNLTTAAASSSPKLSTRGGPNSMIADRKLNNNNNSTTTSPPPFLTGTARGNKPNPLITVADKRSHYLQRSNAGKLSSQQQKQSDRKGVSNTVSPQPEPTLPVLSALNVLLPPHAVKSKTESSIDSQMFTRTESLLAHSTTTASSGGSSKPASEFATFNVQVEEKKNNANYVVVDDPLETLLNGPKTEETEEIEKGCLEAKEGHCTLTVSLVSAVDENQENVQSEEQEEAKIENLESVDLSKVLMVENDNENPENTQTEEQEEEQIANLSSVDLPTDSMVNDNEDSTLFMTSDDTQQEEQHEDFPSEPNDQKEGEDSVTDGPNEEVESCEENKFDSSQMENDTLIIIMNDHESTEAVNNESTVVNTEEKGGESLSSEAERADSLMSNDDHNAASILHETKHDHVHDESMVNEMDKEESENSNNEIIENDKEHNIAVEETVNGESLVAAKEEEEEGKIIVAMEQDHENSATSDENVCLTLTNDEIGDEPSTPSAEHYTDAEEESEPEESGMLTVDSEEMMLFEEDLIRLSSNCTKTQKRNKFSI